MEGLRAKLSQIGLGGADAYLVTERLNALKQTDISGADYNNGETSALILGCILGINQRAEGLFGKVYEMSLAEEALLGNSQVYKGSEIGLALMNHLSNELISKERVSVFRDLLLDNIDPDGSVRTFIDRMKLGLEQLVNNQDPGVRRACCHELMSIGNGVYGNLLPIWERNGAIAREQKESDLVMVSKKEFWFAMHSSGKSGISDFFRDYRYFNGGNDMSLVMRRQSTVDNMLDKIDPDKTIRDGISADFDQSPPSSFLPDEYFLRDFDEYGNLNGMRFTLWGMSREGVKFLFGTLDYWLKNLYIPDFGSEGDIASVKKQAIAQLGMKLESLIAQVHFEPGDIGGIQQIIQFTTFVLAYSDFEYFKELLPDNWRNLVAQ